MLELGRDWINNYKELMADFEAILKSDLSADIDELETKATLKPNSFDQVRHQRTIRRLNIFIKICNEVSRVEPDHSFAYFWRGVAKAKLGQHQEANKDLLKARKASKRMTKKIEEFNKKQAKAKKEREEKENSQPLLTKLKGKIKKWVNTRCP